MCLSNETTLYKFRVSHKLEFPETIIYINPSLPPLKSACIESHIMLSAFLSGVYTLFLSACFDSWIPRPDHIWTSLLPVS